MQQSNNVETPLQLTTASVDNQAKNDKKKDKKKGGSALWIDGEYQGDNHRALEKRRFELDMKIPTIVKNLGQQAVPFVEVNYVKKSDCYQLIYNLNPEFPGSESIRWKAVEAVKKGNGGKFYKEESSGRIKWFYKALEGDMFTYITQSFNDDLVNQTFKDSKSGFSKKMANFIFKNPYVQYTQYSCWFSSLANLIKVFGQGMDAAEVQDVIINISCEMKRVLEYKDKELKLTPLETYQKVRRASARYTIQQCSKAVNFLIDNINIEGQEAENDLDKMDREADEIRRLKQEENVRRLELLKEQMLLKAQQNNALSIKCEEVQSAKRDPEPPRTVFVYKKTQSATTQKAVENIPNSNKRSRPEGTQDVGPSPKVFIVGDKKPVASRMHIEEVVEDEVQVPENENHQPQEEKIDGNQDVNGQYADAADDDGDLFVSP